MKIAHVVSTYPPYRGGTGNMAHEYAIRLRARQHTVRVFTPARAGLATSDGLMPLSAPVRIGNAALVPSLCWHLRGFDIVHLHCPFFGGAEPVLLRTVLHPRQPLIVSYQMDASARGVRGAVFRLHARTVLPVLLARADRVLVTSRDYAESSVLARLDGVLKRVEVHPPGVDLERFHPGDDPGLRSRLGVPEAVPLLLFVGGLDTAHDFKGLPILLEALGTLVDAPWRLVVVGDGDLRGHFEGLTESAGLRDRVDFVGDVSDEDLPRYYRAADLHLFPSTGASEAFGLVVLEAAASGIPTIASSLPGVRTAVRDGETGLLVSPAARGDLAAGIKRVLDRPEFRTRMGAAARRRAEAEFDWSRRLDHLEATYRDVVARCRRQRD